MSKSNVIQIKSYKFALDTIKLCEQIPNDEISRVIMKQLIRSATSIGANVEESIGAQSRNDFIHKLSISYKETRETMYWLRLLLDSKRLDSKTIQPSINACEELLKIIGTILKNTKINTEK